MTARVAADPGTRADTPDEALIRLLRVALGQCSASLVEGESLRGLDSLIGHRHAGAGHHKPSNSRDHLRDATTWTLVETSLQALAEQLRELNHRFVLLKGAALSGLYPAPYLRRTSDLDVLVSPESFKEVRTALERSGWQSVVTGKYGEQYLQEEGSCWQANRLGHAVLELHFRFWGSVPDTFTAAVMDHATPRDDGMLIPSPQHCLIIAAAHSWRQRRPRRAADPLDACLLLRHHGASAFSNLTIASAAAGQSLPVTLTLAQLEQVLNDEPWLTPLREQLETSLRPSEARVLKRLRDRGSDSVSWRRVRFAMLLAGRPSRSGWKSLLRQVWPHRGVLEQRTPSSSPWWIRRATGLWQSAVRKKRTG